MDAPKTILCAKCGIGPERPFDRDGTQWTRCPICGQESRVSDIQCEAIEQHIDRASRGEQSELRASVPSRSYRWVLHYA